MSDRSAGLPRRSHAGSRHAELVGRAVAGLRDRGATLAVAESLTGGALTATLVTFPGVSAVLRGAVVAYAADVKRDLLGVDPDLLAAEGTVHPEVARQMAAGAARRLGATHAVATTGVAGPGPAEGRPAGTVHVAVHAPGLLRVRSLRLAGGRAQLRAASVEVALVLLAGTVDGPHPGAGGP
ncbi:nicotinamide-nucleotide amidase [Georgenia soli]|uniref:Nicotinamide-nucleotide amidase n=1 Tax=Georgenia soli TaxID=638953 RepID=A0A2A9EHR4_9MICO|nr:CinA family protein [Georgenia soli]PFG38454.1 nicotinamide-nucleotide amidase [Georgenia soli]